MGSIPLRIRFDKIDGFIKIYDGIRYLVLFSYSYDEICNRIKYLISEKSGITNSINYNFAKIRIDSVVNENKNKYYYNIFLEKGSYKDKSDTQYF